MPSDADRTAVVIVHGMGEQLPVETLATFVKSALPKYEGERWYYSRSDEVSSSFEARCYRAYRRPWHVTDDDPLVHGNVDFYEYHWSYKMTENRLSDLFRPVLRLLLRPPWRVPSGLRVVWAVVWVLLVTAVAVTVANLGAISRWSRSDVMTGAGITVVSAAVIVYLVRFLLARVGAVIVRTFVDVVRYLDRSPRSYAERKDIRGGLVDLLTELHNSQRFTRVVVVAHSLGGFIAYDALTSLWPQVAELHACPPQDSKKRLDGLAELTEQAKLVETHPDDLDDLDDTQRAELAAFQDRQFDLWEQSRLRGNPWLVTDFVTVGTPMYFADMLLTATRQEFERLTRISELPVCPPRPGTQTVEGVDRSLADQHRDTYSNENDHVEVLNHDAVFAVVRWTNLYFPPVLGFFGDWFGGPLRSLFGTGVRDVPVLGNRPQRFWPAVAHSFYFRYPERLAEDDAAGHLQEVVNLDLEGEDRAAWERLVGAPVFYSDTNPDSPLRFGRTRRAR